VKTTGRSLVTLGFVLYLLCFSSFALYHVYAENELVDTHGCQIGEWVLHAQNTVIAVVLVSIILAPLLYFTPVAPRVRPAPRHAVVWLRGPPHSALL